MDGESSNGLHLRYHQRAYYTPENNLARNICIIEAVAGDLPILIRQECPVCGGNLKGYTLQRGLLVHRAALVDDKAAGMGVLEDEAVCYALLDLDGLGGHIPDESVWSLLFSHD